MSERHDVRATAIQPLLRNADLLRLLPCDVQTLDRVRSSGRLPKPDLTIGRRSPRWRAETIRDWINSGGKVVAR
jgi:predicted DNA-binding transcriptional regulator AlpA